MSKDGILLCSASPALSVRAGLSSPWQKQHSWGPFSSKACSKEVRAAGEEEEEEV